MWIEILLGVGLLVLYIYRYVTKSFDEFKKKGIPYIEGRFATMIFEGFGEVLSKEFIIGWEPLSNIHYTRPGTCINHSLH